MTVEQLNLKLICANLDLALASQNLARIGEWDIWRGGNSDNDTVLF